MLDFHKWPKIMMSSLHAFQTFLLILMQDLKLISGNTEVSLNYIWSSDESSFFFYKKANTKGQKCCCTIWSHVCQKHNELPLVSKYQGNLECVFNDILQMTTSYKVYECSFENLFNIWSLLVPQITLKCLILMWHIARNSGWSWLCLQNIVLQLMTSSLNGL